MKKLVALCTLISVVACTSTPVSKPVPKARTQTIETMIAHVDSDGEYFTLLNNN